jgi:hypothetical protein
VVDSHDQFGPTKETAKDFSSFTTKRGCPQPGGRVEDMHENYSHHLNIYVPLKEAPVNGWPVLVFIQLVFSIYRFWCTIQAVGVRNTTTIPACLSMVTYRTNVLPRMRS